jgi:tetratricopeptide (TPR) repeat protein
MGARRKRTLRLLGAAGAAAFAIGFCVHAPAVRAEPADPNDPFEFSDELQGLSEGITTDANADKDKSALELLLEARVLTMDKRLLDARTKLLRALEKDPTEYRAHVMLSAYYLTEVGHFRLALKYAKQAEALFYQKHGKPPYTTLEQQAFHGDLLNLISQVRLNLDDYPGALSALDEYAKWGYHSDSYAGSRAWILMKLGRVPEAIQVARLGYMSMTGYQERGQLLNMLGILLSMDHQREESLKIFDEAIKFEFTMGELGQPATPLNNAGEVYKEIFQEDKAESSWLKATSLPDGCEHVLPSLNLALMYLEKLDLAAAKRTMDRFEQCIAQYPLRNGEEHRALVHLARGRIAFYTGDLDDAIEHFEGALSHQQWFGKIGTSVDDLRAGALISLAQAVAAKAHEVETTPHDGIFAKIAAFKDVEALRVRAWWVMRRARQILIEDLNNLEDIYVRNTDSLIEYPTFGDVLEGLPRGALKTRLESVQSDDGRSQARTYYAAWRAESEINRGDGEAGWKLANESLSDLRPGNVDDALKLHTTMIKLTQLTPGTPEYRQNAELAFRLNRPAFPRFGVPLPINVVDPKGICDLKGTTFFADNGAPADFSLRCSESGGKLRMEVQAPGMNPISVEAESSPVLVALAEKAVFHISLEARI